MLNAMPLPIGPTESASAIAKPEMNRKAPDKGVTGEDITSFASTLESVHKKSQPTKDDVNPEGDATSDTQSASEDEDVKPKIKNLVGSADGISNLVTQETTVPNIDVDLKIAVSNFEDNTVSAETPTTSVNDVMEDMVGAQQKTAMPLHPTTPDFTLPRQPAAVNDAPQEGEDGHGASGDTLLQESAIALKTAVQASVEAGEPATGAQDSESIQEGATALKTAVQASVQAGKPATGVQDSESIQEDAIALKTAAQASVQAGKPATGAQDSESIVDQSYQASQIMEDAPDRKMAQKTHQNALDGFMKQDAKVDDTLIKPALEESQSQLKSKDNPAPPLQHKGNENPRTEGETPTPGKLKAEVLDFQTVRSTQVDDATETPKPFGDRVPETPMNMMSDGASPMADRQGGFDPMPSFSTSPSDGKGVMASGHTNAAPPTADIFTQENFHQLVERAMFTVRGEQSEARIALKPDHLGHVQMKIVTENNLVSIKIITETPAARDLIDANANQLKAELQHQGLNVENIQVSVSDERHDAYRQARQRESFMRHMTPRGTASSEEDSEIPGNRLAQRETNRGRVAGIDYFA
jgi:flagellar hook-length control protein FliK